MGLSHNSLSVTELGGAPGNPGLSAADFEAPSHAGLLISLDCSQHSQTFSVFTNHDDLYRSPTFPPRTGPVQTSKERQYLAPVGPEAVTRAGSTSRVCDEPETDRTAVSGAGACLTIAEAVEAE